MVRLAEALCYAGACGFAVGGVATVALGLLGFVTTGGSIVAALGSIGAPSFAVLLAGILMAPKHPRLRQSARALGNLVLWTVVVCGAGAILLLAFSGI